jgi:hypothetical protein
MLQTSLIVLVGRVLRGMYARHRARYLALPTILNDASRLKGLGIVWANQPRVRPCEVPKVFLQILCGCQPRVCRRVRTLWVLGVMVLSFPIAIV